MGNDLDACSVFKFYLHKCFNIKDLGPLKFFLGIEVDQSPKGLFNVPLQVCFKYFVRDRAAWEQAG